MHDEFEAVKRVVSHLALEVSPLKPVALAANVNLQVAVVVKVFSCGRKARLEHVFEGRIVD